MAGRLPVGAGCHAGGVTPVRAVLLDFYCTLVDLSAPVRSRGFDDFAWRLGLPLGPGELYRRYTEMITSESAQDAVPGFEPYRTSWLAAGRWLLAPFGREPAAGQFADEYADMYAYSVTFPEVPEIVIDLIDRPSEKPWGAGEPSAAVVPSAISNAVFDATGVRLRSVPFTPEKVKTAMRGAA